MLADLNPIPAILSSAEFAEVRAIMAARASMADALVTPDAQALLYILIRQIRPGRAIEIGTYKASTTEAMAMAVADNSVGRLLTVDPFGRSVVPPIMSRWPQRLIDVTDANFIDSMMFFAEMIRRNERAGLIFIDGNHDYEFALFDIQCAAKLIEPSGFLMIDNIAQPGPYFAALTFMERGRGLGWIECGNSLERYRDGEIFDRHRTTIHNTDFCILRAPRAIALGAAPQCFGDLPWRDGQSRLVIDRANAGAGILRAQFVIRIFESTPREIIETANATSENAETISLQIVFPSSDDRDARRTIEPWLTWSGQSELQMRDYPRII